MKNPSGKTTTTPPLSVNSAFTINFPLSRIQKNFLISASQSTEEEDMFSTEPPQMNGHKDAHSTNGILKNSAEKKWIVQ